MLSQKFEETAQAQSQDLKEFIREEFKTFEHRMEARFNSIEGKITTGDESLRAELHASLRDQTFKFVTIMMAMITLAVAVIKLFPNLQ